jgi:acyl-CoA thioesterase FadM
MDHTAVTMRWVCNDQATGRWLTASLEVIYKKPLLIHTTYVFESNLEKVNDRKFRMVTIGRDSDGSVCIESSAFLVQRRENTNATSKL